jgi:hypothetical protein
MEPEGSLPFSQGFATVPILSQMNPVQIFPPYIPTIHSNIILPSTPKSFTWSLPFRFPNHRTLRVFVEAIDWNAKPQESEHTKFPLTHELHTFPVRSV